MAITAPASVESSNEIRTCRRCLETKPLDEFVKNNRAGRLHICKACRRAARQRTNRAAIERGDLLRSSSDRQRLADKRALLGWNEIDGAPDPQPARLLVELLAYDRSFGLDFEAAWTEDVEFVLERIDVARNRQRMRAEREVWGVVFEQTREAFEAAWRREPGPGSTLSPALLEGLNAAHESG